VFSTRLRITIATNIAVLLLIGMLSIGFVAIITSQRDMLRLDISKAHLLITAVEGHLKDLKKYETLDIDFIYLLHKLLKESDFSSAFLLIKASQQKYYFGSGDYKQIDLEQKTLQAMRFQTRQKYYLGEKWGFFGKKRKKLIISAPLFRSGKIIAGISVVYPLEKNYLLFKKIETLVVIYILVNTAILVYIGVYRLSRIILTPLQRLAKRVDEYSDDSQLLFLDNKWDNEFNKLSKSINSMLSRIVEDKEKLRLSVQSLEKSNLKLKNAQDEIIRAEKLASVGRLSAGIAHEIGNPIGIVIGYLELLKQADISAQERHDFLRRTENEISRIDVIIKQLLDFSRVTSEKCQTVGIHQLIEETAAVVQFQPEMENIALKLEFNSSKDAVMADSDKLRQVFLNLILNAIDAISDDSLKTKKPGEITIATQLLDQEDEAAVMNQPTIRITFSDNGKGISEQNIGKIFDPFFTTKSPGKGTGLGLSVSFRIIEGFHGKIEVVSKPLKETVVTICLPLTTHMSDKDDWDGCSNE
jgi:two-component system NtrC family sensor kinase